MDTDLKFLAIIPARGGSKGIPKKNIFPLNGKPLIQYMVEAIQGSKYPFRLIVSTDDLEIASVSRKLKCDVCMRPEDISQDDSISEDALLHVLGELKKTEEYCPDILGFFQCTSPLITSDTIDKTMGMFFNENADVVLTVTPFKKFLWENKLGTNELRTVNFNSGNRRQPRQQITPQWLETGGVYILGARKFLVVRNRFFGRIVGVEVPQEVAYDIDTLEELQAVEGIMRKSLIPMSF